MFIQTAIISSVVIDSSPLVVFVVPTTLFLYVGVDVLVVSMIILFFGYSDFGR